MDPWMEDENLSFDLHEDDLVIHTTTGPIMVCL